MVMIPLRTKNKQLQSVPKDSSHLGGNNLWDGGAGSDEDNIGPSPSPLGPNNPSKLIFP